MNLIVINGTKTLLEGTKFQNPELYFLIKPHYFGEYVRIEDFKKATHIKVKNRWGEFRYFAKRRFKLVK